MFALNVEASASISLSATVTALVATLHPEAKVRLEVSLQACVAGHTGALVPMDYERVSNSSVKMA